jgi:hypothetical protein
MKINPMKISFIICTNDETYYRECCLYLEQLQIPAGFETEVIPVSGAASMTAGYETAMKQCDDKYKIYLHQDVLILNRNFLTDTLEILTHNPKIGMLGMVGTKQLPDNGCMWSSPMRTGALRSCTLQTTDDFFDIPIAAGRRFSPVQAVDGLLMMTQYDVAWRTDLFTGWDFYDVSQSLEFAKKDYRIAVPYQKSPWVLHDCGFMNLSHYHEARKVFLEEYFPEHTDAIKDCKKRIKANKTEKQNESQQKIITKIKSLLNQGLYEKACAVARKHLPECHSNYLFCIFAVFLQIYETEASTGTPEIFSFLSTHSADALPEHFKKIKLYLWRIEYQLPETYIQEALAYFKKYHVSEATLNYIRLFCLC